MVNPYFLCIDLYLKLLFPKTPTLEENVEYIRLDVSKLIYLDLGL